MLSVTRFVHPAAPTVRPVGFHVTANPPGDEGSKLPVLLRSDHLASRLRSLWLKADCTRNSIDCCLSALTYRSASGLGVRVVASMARPIVVCKRSMPAEVIFGSLVLCVLSYQQSEGWKHKAVPHPVAAKSHRDGPDSARYSARYSARCSARYSARWEIPPGFCKCNVSH